MVEMKQFDLDVFQNNVLNQVKELANASGDMCYCAMSDPKGSVEPFVTANRLLSARHIKETICPGLKNIRNDEQKHQHSN